VRVRSGLERVLLVGFMGAGKSTVGRLLADAMGWRFVDADALVESGEGRTIGEIFRVEGEAYFRDREAGVMMSLLGERQIVVATGGGWSARPGRLKDVPPGTVSVWLRLSPDEAVRRSEEQDVERPLLDVADQMDAVRGLYEKREEYYAEADLQVDTEGRTPKDVSARVLKILHQRHRVNPDR
jgi:shikimate kinase